MKKVLLDASSAILLLKAGLLDKLIQLYHVSQTQSVLHELTRENFHGAGIFRQYAMHGKVTIIAEQNIQFSGTYTGQSLDLLDQGERDTIRCFLAGNHDFIILDDGRAARFCHRNNIAFINALLFPRLLYFKEILPLDMCDEFMEKLIRVGRYSPEVIAWSQNCKKESLRFAIPSKCGIDMEYTDCPKRSVE